MFKFVLGALASLMLVMTPPADAKVERKQAVKTQKQSVSKSKARSSVKATAPAKAGKARNKRRDVAVRTSNRAQPRIVRRIVTVEGKPRVEYQRVIGAGTVPERPRMSAGDLAGLNLTRDPLDLKSSVAFVMDQNNSEILFDKNSSVSLPIASITKLMTGLIVVEARRDRNEVLTVTEDDVDQEKFTSARLRVGSRMTRGDMLHIALMSSENRAASALGRHYPGGITAFVEAMNARARSLGMSDTRYVDSSGLSSRNVASARDLAKLAVVAYHQPLLRQFSTDPKATVDAGARMMNYNNTNYLVAMPDWDIGLQKTGFINEAGRCLVMQTVIHGRSVIMVFLDSKGKQSRTADAGRVRRWLEALRPINIGQTVATPAPATP